MILVYCNTDIGKHANEYLIHHFFIYYQYMMTRLHAGPRNPRDHLYDQCRCNTPHQICMWVCCDMFWCYNIIHLRVIHLIDLLVSFRVASLALWRIRIMKYYKYWFEKGCTTMMVNTSYITGVISPPNLRCRFRWPVNTLYRKRA